MLPEIVKIAEEKIETIKAKYGCEISITWHHDWYYFLTGIERLSIEWKDKKDMPFIWVDTGDGTCKPGKIDISIKHSAGTIGNMETFTLKEYKQFLKVQRKATKIIKELEEWLDFYRTEFMEKERIYLKVKEYDGEVIKEIGTKVEDGWLYDIYQMPNGQKLYCKYEDDQNEVYVYLFNEEEYKKDPTQYGEYVGYFNGLSDDKRFRATDFYPC